MKGAAVRHSWQMLADGLPWVLGAAPFTLCALVVVHRWRVSRWHRRQARTATAVDGLLAGALLAIMALTLAPSQGVSHTGLEWGVRLVPLTSIVEVVTRSVDPSVWVRIVVLNIVLFIPLGFSLVLRVRRVLHVTVIGAAVAAAVEILQMLLPLGRTSNVDDLLLNTAGVLIGASVGRTTAAHIRKLLQPRAEMPREAMWLALAPSALAIVAFMGLVSTALLLDAGPVTRPVEGAVGSAHP